jgi:hypothetical protein
MNIRCSAYVPFTDSGGSANHDGNSRVEKSRLMNALRDFLSLTKSAPGDFSGRLARSEWLPNR